MSALRPVLALAVALLALLAPSASPAQEVPRTMTFQGRLVRTDGTPEDRPQDLYFALYESPTGGSAVWQEFYPGVAVTNGYYAVLLGSTVPLRDEVVRRGTLYLGVAISGQAELTPRVRLASVPFALRAADSQLLAGRDAGSFADTGHGHPTATTSTPGFLSPEDKAKLDTPEPTYGEGLTASGTPLNVRVRFPATGGTAGASTSAARADHSHAVATPTAAGFMSAADKAKLDTPGPTYGEGLTASGTPPTVSVSFPASGGTAGTAASAARSNHSHGAASTTSAGFMPAADKAKLDTLAPPADGLTVSGSPARLRVDFPAAGATTGSALTAARSDHSHALACIQRGDTGNDADPLASVTFCAPTEFLAGGGCGGLDSGLVFMPVGPTTAASASPAGNQGYRCRNSDGGTTRPTAYAICCRLQ